jgi:hypothetical protein
LLMLTITNLTFERAGAHTATLNSPQEQPNPF